MSDGPDPDARELVQERTFAAWMRTSLAAIGFAVGLVKLVPDHDLAWLLRLMAILFVFLGVVVCVASIKNYAEVARKLEAEGMRKLPLGTPRLLSGLIILD